MLIKRHNGEDALATYSNVLLGSKCAQEYHGGWRNRKCHELSIVKKPPGETQHTFLQSLRATSSFEFSLCVRLGHTSFFSVRIWPLYIPNGNYTAFSCLRGICALCECVCQWLLPNCDSLQLVSRRVHCYCDRCWFWGSLTLPSHLTSQKSTFSMI